MTTFATQFPELEAKMAVEVEVAKRLGTIQKNAAGEPDLDTIRKSLVDQAIEDGHMTHSQGGRAKDTITISRLEPDVEHHRQADNLRTGLKVAERRAFCHEQKLDRHPALHKRVSSDTAGACSSDPSQSRPAQSDENSQRGTWRCPQYRRHRMFCHRTTFRGERSSQILTGVTQTPVCSLRR